MRTAIKRGTGAPIPQKVNETGNQTNGRGMSEGTDPAAAGLHVRGDVIKMTE